MAVVIVRDRLAMSKQITHRFRVKRLNLNKLKKVEGKEKYRIELSNKLATLEILYPDEDINRAWETIRDNIKISAKESLGYYELKKNKPWIDEGCSEYKT
jgi:hypothetical protein